MYKFDTNYFKESDFKFNYFKFNIFVLIIQLFFLMLVYFLLNEFFIIFVFYPYVTHLKLYRNLRLGPYIDARKWCYDPRFVVDVVILLLHRFKVYYFMTSFFYIMFMGCLAFSAPTKIALFVPIDIFSYAVLFFVLDTQFDNNLMKIIYILWLEYVKDNENWHVFIVWMHMIGLINDPINALFYIFIYIFVLPFYLFKYIRNNVRDYIEPDHIRKFLEIQGYYELKTKLIEIIVRRRMYRLMFCCVFCYVVVVDGYYRYIVPRFFN